MINFILQKVAEKKQISPQTVAELVFGKLTTNIDNLDLKQKTGTKFVTWEVEDSEVIPEQMRLVLLRKLRGKDFNYAGFTSPRILCALGYQCIQKEDAPDTKHTTVNFTTLFTPITPKIEGGETLALRTVKSWHDCEVPYTTEEILLLQHTVTKEIATRKQWYDNLPEQRKDLIEQALSLKVNDITSGKLYLFDYLYDLLIEVGFNADPSY